jgi:hypothetical protein
MNVVASSIIGSSVGSGASVGSSGASVGSSGASVGGGGGVSVAASPPQAVKIALTSNTTSINQLILRTDFTFPPPKKKVGRF